MKKLLTFSFIFLLIILTGCVTTHNENINKKFKDFWDYSLGEYSISSEWRNDNGGGSGGFTTNKYKLFTFSFKDDNGLNSELKVSNYYDNFNKELLDSTRTFLYPKLDEEISKYSFNKIREVASIGTSVSIYIELEQIDKNKSLYDSNNGIKFKSLKLNNTSDYNLKKKFSTTIYLNDSIENVTNLDKILIEDYSFLINNKYDSIEFNIKGKDEYYAEKYILTYDGYNYNFDKK